MKGNENAPRQLIALLARRPFKVVALANKMARVIVVAPLFVPAIAEASPGKQARRAARPADESSITIEFEIDGVTFLSAPAQAGTIATVTGTPDILRAWRRQANDCWGVSPWHRATSQTLAPLSAMIAVS